MNKDNYYKAMDKIKASDELKDKILASVTLGQKRKSGINMKRVVAVAAMFALLISTIFFADLRKLDNKDIAGNFKITGETDPNSQLSYMLALHLDGYSYEDSVWTRYSLNETLEDLVLTKGDKIGEVNLDLKGMTYEGTPPDFSSTYGVGTEVYEIKGIKKEYAVLMESGDMKHILYRTRKALASENESIGLTIDQVINMISNNPLINSVELRNEIDGSWMRTSFDKDLLDLINRDLKNKEILSYEELRKPEVDFGIRIPINLMLEDGAGLHMQIYPESKAAYIFGGYIDLSESLTAKFVELNNLGNEFSKITDIVGYELSDLGYFKFTNHNTGDEILSPDPLWSGEVFYSFVNFYSVDKSPLDLEGNLVFTVILGESEENSNKLQIYEGEDKNLFFVVNGEKYEIVKGSLHYDDLLMFQENYTSY